jgi:hypothetical protein
LHAGAEAFHTTLCPASATARGLLNAPGACSRTPQWPPGKPVPWASGYASVDSNPPKQRDLRWWPRSARTSRSPSWPGCWMSRPATTAGGPPRTPALPALTWVLATAQRRQLRSEHAPSLLDVLTSANNRGHWLSCYGGRWISGGLYEVLGRAPNDDVAEQPPTRW